MSRGGGEPKRFDPARYGNFRRIGRNADGCTYMDNTGTIIMTRFGRAGDGRGSASLPGAAECLMLCLLAGAVFTAVNQLVDWTAPGGPVPDGALVRRLLVRSGAVGEDVRFLTARLAEGGGRLGGRLADLWQQLAAAFQQVRSLW